METLLRNQDGNTVTKVIKLGPNSYRLDVIWLGNNPQSISQKNYDSYYQVATAYKNLTK